MYICSLIFSVSLNLNYSSAVAQIIIYIIIQILIVILSSPANFNWFKYIFILFCVLYLNVVKIPTEGIPGEWNIILKRIDIKNNKLSSNLPVSAFQSSSHFQ